jgi:hypothetical protein
MLGNAVADPRLCVGFEAIGFAAFGAGGAALSADDVLAVWHSPQHHGKFARLTQ